MEQFFVNLASRLEGYDTFETEALAFKVRESCLYIKSYQAFVKLARHIYQTNIAHPTGRREKA